MLVPCTAVSGGADAAPHIPQGSGRCLPASHQCCCGCGLRCLQSCLPPAWEAVCAGAGGLFGAGKAIRRPLFRGQRWAAQQWMPVPIHRRGWLCARLERATGIGDTGWPQACTPRQGQAVEQAESGSRQDTKPHAAACSHLLIPVAPQHSSEMGRTLVPVPQSGSQQDTKGQERTGDGEGRCTQTTKSLCGEHQDPALCAMATTPCGAPRPLYHW